MMCFEDGERAAGQGLQASIETLKARKKKKDFPLEPPEEAQPQ